jgi:2-polyprenyl-3-methyl-5-hydroxy-6-metoxy-1,4-benzoquinol methylase
MSVHGSITDLSAKTPTYYSHTRPEMLPFIPATAKRVLDVGCSEGGFAAQLKQILGAEVWGIELNPSVAERARQKLDRVLAGDIGEQLEQLPDGYFDCVTFNDVLEHLVDPYRILLALKQKLSPDGVIVASIPNIRYFHTLFALVVRGEWRYEDEGILDKTHLRFFTKKSIIEMFETLGYRVIRIEGINQSSGRKTKLLKLITFGGMSDIEFLEFACVARPVDR